MVETNAAEGMLTRDKMSAARRKGKWIGGHPVLGYDIDPKGGRLLDRSCAARIGDDNVRRDWHVARAIMTGYATRYPQEDFEIVALEKTFEGPIINPATGAASRSFVLAGKVDGIVRVGGDHYRLLHKPGDAGGGGGAWGRPIPFPGG